MANICVYADQQKAKPIAIIVPVDGELKKLAKSVGVNETELEALCKSKKVQNEVLKALQSVGKAGGLSGIEIIEGVVLADEEWTPANVSLSYSVVDHANLPGTGNVRSKAQQKEDLGQIPERG